MIAVYVDNNNDKDKIVFKRKNLVSCSNVSMRKLLFEYICWVLSGKPVKEEDK